MPAKKSESGTKKAADQAGAVILEAPAEPVVEPAIIMPYTVSSWAGRDNYECKLCPYSTLSKAQIVAHVARHFRAAPAEAAFEPGKTHSD